MIDTPENNNTGETAVEGGTQVNETDDILKWGSHPKYESVKSWASESEQNKTWYEANKKTLFQNPNFVTLAGYILAPQPLGGFFDYYGGLEKLSDTEFQNYPDLEVILNFLPGDGENAIIFFERVLGISLSLGHINKKGERVFQGESVCIWSKTESTENGKANFLNLTSYCYIDTEESTRLHTVIGCK